MFKELAAFMLMLCSGLLLINPQAKALDLDNIEPENCYVISALSNKVEAMGGDNVLPAEYKSISQLAELATPFNKHSSRTAASLNTELWADVDHKFKRLAHSQASSQLNVLPIPVWLLFFGLWLIGFKLTSQPSPSLNRSATCRFGKDHVLTNLGQASNSVAC
jgi:hypothetical protein